MRAMAAESSYDGVTLPAGVSRDVDDEVPWRALPMSEVIAFSLRGVRPRMPVQEPDLLKPQRTRDAETGWVLPATVTAENFSPPWKYFASLSAT
jgi:hypothetical protein